MQIDLANMDLYAGQRLISFDNSKEVSALHLGSFCVCKRGPSLLREKCQLKLQLESNLDSMLTHVGKFYFLHTPLQSSNSYIVNHSSLAIALQFQMLVCVEHCQG